MNRCRAMQNHVIGITLMLSVGAAYAVDIEQTIEVVADDEAFADPFVPEEEFLTQEQIEEAFEEASGSTPAEEQGDIFTSGERGETERDALLGILDLDSGLLGLDSGLLGLELDSLTDVLDILDGDLLDAVSELAELDGLLDLDNLLGVLNL
jgi:hypothetical protein